MGFPNLEKCIKTTLHYSLKIESTWAFDIYEEKQTLRKNLFPRGFFSIAKMTDAEPRV